VKSAFHVLEDKKSFEAQQQEGASSSGSQNPIIDWLRLWKIPVLPKMKHFLYRLAQNSIPLKMSLKRRGIDTDTGCLVCIG
jgi:hypothetical protein